MYFSKLIIAMWNISSYRVHSCFQWRPVCNRTSILPHALSRQHSSIMDWKHSVRNAAVHACTTTRTSSASISEIITHGWSNAPSQRLRWNWSFCWIHHAPWQAVTQHKKCKHILLTDWVEGTCPFRLHKLCTYDQAEKYKNQKIY